jgi:NTP pyrophosphatase (non-canonical NTP hydrolase)
MSFTRPQVTDEILNRTLEEMVRAAGSRIEKKGMGAFVSNHEGLGIIAEEYHELLEAVRSNDPVEVASEAMDVAVGCIFLVASLLQKEADLKAAQVELEALTEV